MSDEQDNDTGTAQAMNRPAEKDNKPKKQGRPSSREALIKQKLENRTPMVRAAKLEAEIPDQMTGHWFNDEPGRINQALKAGWVFIDAEAAVLNSEVKEDLAKRRGYRVGSNEDGSPLMAYLMAIETEIYEHDQRAKQTVNDRIMEDIERNVPKADSGESNENTHLKQSDFTVSTS